MCNLWPFRWWLIGTLLAMTAALGFVISAAAANLSWMQAAQSPILMLLAGVTTSGAVFLAGSARDALKNYCECAGSKCSGPCGNMNGTLVAAMVVLGIQASACYSAAALAWIPILGVAPMLIITGALFVQLVLLISALAFLVPLSSCQNQNA